MSDEFNACLDCDGPHPIGEPHVIDCCPDCGDNTRCGSDWHSDDNGAELRFLHAEIKRLREEVDAAFNKGYDEGQSHVWGGMR